MKPIAKDEINAVLKKLMRVKWREFQRNFPAVAKREHEEMVWRNGFVTGFYMAVLMVQRGELRVKKVRDGTRTK